MSASSQALQGPASSEVYFPFIVSSSGASLREAGSAGQPWRGLGERGRKLPSSGLCALQVCSRRNCEAAVVVQLGLELGGPGDPPGRAGWGSLES